MFWMGLTGVGWQASLIVDIVWLSMMISWCWRHNFSHCWLSNDGLLDGWDDCLLDGISWLSRDDFGVDWGVVDCSSFFVHNSVESVNGISSVVDNATRSISFDQWVLSLNNITVSWFSLRLGITSEWIMDVVWELVLRIWIVVINVGLLDVCWWSDCLLDDWCWVNQSLLEIGWLVMVNSDSWLLVIDSSLLNVSWLMISYSRLSDNSSTSNCDDGSECNELWKIEFSWIKN